MNNLNSKTIISVSIFTILKVVAVLLALWFLFLIRDILMILFVALILSALIDPLADWFQSRKIPRAIAVLLIYVVLLGLLSLVLVLLIPPLLGQAEEALGNFSIYWEKVSQGIDSFRQFTAEQGVLESLKENLSSFQASVSRILSGAFATVVGFFGGLVTFILILVITFYMVVEKESLKKVFYALAPEKYHAHLVELLNRAQKKIGAWSRGVLILGLIVGVLAYIGLLALGVEYALVLGLIAGIGELIPYIGPIISAIPAVFLAFTQSPLLALFTIILYIVIQQVENNFLVPKVMQKVAGLNPIISIIAFSIGFKLAGIGGAILAIPVALALSVIIKDFLEIKEQMHD